jgi:hypothetical protein
MGWFDGLSGFEWIVIIQLSLVILFLWDLNKRGNEEKGERYMRWRALEKHLDDISGQVGYICRQMDEHKILMGLIRDELREDIDPRMLEL